MTVAEFIEHLKTFPQEARVSAFNGGGYKHFVVKKDVELEQYLTGDIVHIGSKL